MILIITNKKDITTDYLINELNQRKFGFVRFNTEDFPQKIMLHWEPDNLKDSYLIFPKIKLRLGDITSVYYRRPIKPIPNSGITDLESKQYIVSESIATLEGIFECLECYWMSKPNSIRRAENKLIQLKIASDIGFNIPKTIITNIPGSFDNFYQNNDNTINKPIKSGRLETNKHLKLIYTNIISADDAKYSNLIKYSPSLFQEYIEKEVDLRITIIGRKIFPVAINSQGRQKTKIDWRRGIDDDLTYTPIKLPHDIELKCFKLMDYFNLTFSAMDLILSKSNEYIFLELNPNGQWAWIQQATGQPMVQCMADILNNGNISNYMK